MITLPKGYPTPTSMRTRDIGREEFTALGYTEAEAWTLYYSQRKRCVEDPLSPMGEIIRNKTIGDAKGNALQLTPREQAWIDDRTALRADPAIRLLMDSAERAGTPIEQTQAELAAGELGQAALRAAGRIS